jgi:hypothetical protein
VTRPDNYGIVGMRQFLHQQPKIERKLYLDDLNSIVFMSIV